MTSKTPPGSDGVKTARLKDIYAKVLPRNLRRRTVHESSFKENTNDDSKRHARRLTNFTIEDPPSSGSSRSQPLDQGSCERNEEADGQRSGRKRFLPVANDGWGDTSPSPSSSLGLRGKRLETHFEEDPNAQCSEENGNKTKTAPPKPPRRTLSREEWCPPNLSSSFCTSLNSENNAGTRAQSSPAASPLQQHVHLTSAAKPHTTAGSQQNHNVGPNSKPAGSSEKRRGSESNNADQLSRPRGIIRQNSVSLDEGETVVCPTPQSGPAVVTMKEKEIPAADVQRGYVCLSERVGLVGNADANHLRSPPNPRAKAAFSGDKPAQPEHIAVSRDVSPQKQHPDSSSSVEDSPPSERSVHGSDKSESSGEFTEKEHFTGISVCNPVYNLTKVDLQRLRDRNATGTKSTESESKTETGNETQSKSESNDRAVTEGAVQTASKSPSTVLPNSERQNVSQSNDRLVPDSSTQGMPEASGKTASVQSLHKYSREDHSREGENFKPALHRTVSSESSCSMLSRTEPTEHVLCADDTLTVLQTCSTCLQPCSDPRLLLCFHIVCPDCVEASTQERDDGYVIVCGVCQKEQASTAEGPTSLSDIYPGLISETYGTPDYSGSCQYEKIYPPNRAPLARSHSSAGGSTETKVNSEKADSAGLLTRTNSCPAASGDMKYQTYPKTQSVEKTDSSYQKNNMFDVFRQKPTSCNMPVAPLSKNTTSEKHLDKNSSKTSCSIQSLSDKNKSISSRTIDSLISPAPSTQSLTSACKAKLCGACQKSSDTFHTCVTCGGIMLCDACHVAHQNLPVTRSHEVVPVSATPVSPLMILARRQPTCHIHGQDIALTCATCGVFLCHRCTAPHHSRHDLKELATLHQTKRKQLVTLQRSIKQHVLAARSAQRSLDGQLAKTEAARQALCTSIQTTRERCIQRITSQADDMTTEVQQRSAERRTMLEKNRAGARNSQKEGQKLRCVLEALNEQTPHLTSLALLHTCQARYDALRTQALLSVEESDEMVFCMNKVLNTLLQGQAPFGNLRTLVSGVSDNVMTVMRTFKALPDLSGLAATPYGEVVCISAESGRCQVWDIRGEMLVDASRHFQRPSAVQTTPSGVIVILDEDTTSGHGKGVACCLKLLSPAGTLLSKIPLSTAISSTKIHCPDDRTVVISDEVRQTVSMCTLQKGSVELKALRVVKHHKHLIAPRHVNVNITGDWVVSENGSTLQVVSPSDDVTTLLCTDEIDAVLLPPRRNARGPRLPPARSLGDVCCDSRGRVIAADVKKCGIYVITGGEVSKKEHNFVLLKDLSPAANMAAICVDDQDKVFVGMSDGMITVLKIGPPTASD